MSTILIVKTRVAAATKSGIHPVPLGSSEVINGERIISSASSQSSSDLAGADTGDSPETYIWHIVNGGDTDVAKSVPVYLAFGESPTAVATGAGMRTLLPVGGTFECCSIVDGERVAVINADVTE